MSQYTQEHDEYIFHDGFMHWLPGYENYQPMRTYFAGGYKIHVSVHADDGMRLAVAILPLLRDMALYHKIIPDWPRYDAMNHGLQLGKFITIYSGPLQDTFLRVTKELDQVLCAHRFTPGPTPKERLGGHQVEEQAIGLSGLLFYTTREDYEH